MASVSDLTIKLQSGSDNTYYASWKFDDGNKTSTTSSGVIKAGDWVKIKSGATYYNGVSIPSWVMSDTWHVDQVTGDRAVLGKNKSGSHDICSPINVKYLDNGSGSSTTVTENTLDHYAISWYYDTGDSIWFSGGDSSTGTKNYATYSPPSNAIRIKASVKPVAKQHKVNGKDTYYWTGKAVQCVYTLANDPPEKPGTPTVKLNGYTLTATLENISDPRTDKLEFQIYRGTSVASSGVDKVVTRKASYSCSVSDGGQYRARCRSINLVGNASTYVYGEWSDFSSTINTNPYAPGSLECKATSETSVYISWDNLANATSYELEYTTKKSYFDGSDKTTVVSNIEYDHYEKTGLESGQEYFFRVRSVKDQEKSKWSAIASIILGKNPSAPTTWSSSTKVVVGEPLVLYWVHNSEDGSSQTYADLELYIDGVKESHTIKNSTDENEKDKTSSYSINTSTYKEGTVIQWRVRTAGITKAYGDWSIQRTIDIYAPPTLELTTKDVEGTPINVITTFPFYIHALAGPKTQLPIGYHVEITSKEAYETIDTIGNKKIVNAGESVYSKYFDISDSLLLEMSANNIDLENTVGYTIVCTVSMDSGLTADASLDFTVSWTEVTFEPDAEISIDNDTLVAYIRPYCLDENGTPIDNVMLSVYRRDFDGSYIEIAKNLDNGKNVFITDPHPALDYARYRIIATTVSTGAVSYYDVPNYPVGEKAIIIQWDDEWTNFDTENEDAMLEPPWTGSMLKLPYNVDVSDRGKSDVSLIKYIGRMFPVGYYGTHVDYSSTWNVDIEKDDEETLYGLRRLAIWTGNVYVREPSGSGYWASISVSFNQKHCDLTIPVTIEITRVEGGA